MKWVSIFMVGAMLSLPADRALGDDEDVIEYRQNIMEAMDAQAAALGQILTEMIPDDNFVSHLDVIVINSRLALGSFEKRVEGGEALPEVWEDWDDFSARMKEFSEGISVAAEIAREQGRYAAMGNIIDSLTCKQCHDVYRKEE